MNSDSNHGNPAAHQGRDGVHAVPGFGGVGGEGLLASRS